MKRFIILITNLLLLSILAYCGYNVYIKFKDYKQADITYEKVRKLKKEDLSNINPNFRFWITVENTNIDYPVLQGTDNNFYLDKDIYKNKLGSGSIFMDYRNKSENDENTIIYGHNMKNKTMFSQLEDFKDENFFNKNNKIRIITNDKEYVYEVFSAYYVDPSYNYIIPNFNNNKEYEKYLNEITNKSINKSNISVSRKDKIITLSTCSYETNNTRTVVHGKLVDVINLNN